VWIKLSLSNQPPIHICLSYRPPNSDLYSVEKLSVSLSLAKLTSSSNTQSNIVAMGDFNFPSITWYCGYGSIEVAPTYGSVLNTRFDK